MKLVTGLSKLVDVYGGPNPGTLNVKPEENVLK